jgi:hypothetical protein
MVIISLPYPGLSILLRNRDDRALQIKNYLSTCFCSQEIKMDRSRTTKVKSHPGNFGVDWTVKVSKEISFEVKRSQFDAGGYVKFAYKKGANINVWLNLGMKPWQRLREYIPLAEEYMEGMKKGENGQLKPVPTELSTVLTASVTELIKRDSSEPKMAMKWCDGHGRKKVIYFGLEAVKQLALLADAIDCVLGQIELENTNSEEEEEAEEEGMDAEEAEVVADHNSTGAKRRLSYGAAGGDKDTKLARWEVSEIEAMTLAEPTKVLLYRYLIEHNNGARPDLKSAARYGSMEKAIEEGESHLAVVDDMNILNYKVKGFQEEIILSSAYDLMAWVYEGLLRREMLASIPRGEHPVAGEGCVYDATDLSDSEWLTLLDTNYTSVLGTYVTEAKLKCAFTWMCDSIQLPVHCAGWLSVAIRAFPLAGEMKQRLMSRRSDVIDPRFDWLLKEALKTTEA